MRRQHWAALALYASVASMLATQAGPRSPDVAGLETHPGGMALLAAQMLQYGAAAAAVIALVTQPMTHRSPRWFVLGLWGLVATKLVGGLLATDTPGAGGLDLSFALWAVVMHAGVAAAVDDQLFLRHLRRLARIVTLLSLATLVLAPSWGVLPLDISGRALAGVGRLTGVVPHPNTLAMVSLAALALELLPLASGRWARILGIASALGCLVFAQSTTAWVGGGLLLAVTFWARSRWKPLVATFAVLGGLGAALLGVPQALAASIGSERLETLSGRGVIWQYAWAQIQNHPIIGSGIGFFSPDYRIAFLPATEQQAVHAHNQFLQTLGESGVVGALALAVLLVGLAINAAQSWRADAGVRLGALVALLLEFMVEVPIRPFGASGLAGLLFLVLLASRAQTAVPAASRHVVPSDQTGLETVVS